MPGQYVTQSRKIGPVPPVEQVVNRFNPHEGPWVSTKDWQMSYWPQGSQTTTSWRTGRQAMGPDVEEDEVLNSESSSELRATLRKQRKRRSTRDTGYDTGHTFSTQNTQYEDDFPVVNVNCNSGYYSGTWNYKGVLRPSYSFIMAGGGHTPVLNPLGSTTWYETTAINRTLPTHPVASLTYSLGELRKHGLPTLSGSQLLRDRSKALKNRSGSEYLNVEFGWKPLVADLAKTMYAIDQSASLWRQRVRDSGRIVRRGYVFPVERETTSERIVYPYLVDDPTSMLYGAALLDGSQTLTQTLTKERRVWFKAGYSYYLPDHDVSTSVGKMYAYEERVHGLLGTRLTPEVVWNLQPWSWLVDWNVNIGTNISNAEAFSQDGLVIRFGYLMIQDVSRWSWTLSGVRFRGGQTLAPVSGSVVSTRKERMQASPFGFGLNPGSFTGRQWAILGALGMTKSPGTLRRG